MIFNVSGMCFDNSGNLVLASGSCVRRISVSADVTTLAGSFDQYGFLDGPGHLARFRAASGVSFFKGQFFETDSVDHRIRSLAFIAESQAVDGADLAPGMCPGLTVSGVVGRS